MPIFEFKCKDCNKTMEILIIRSDDEPECTYCRSKNLQKNISATSSILNKNSNAFSNGHSCAGASGG